MKKNLLLTIFAFCCITFGFSQADCANALTLTPGTPQAGDSAGQAGDFDGGGAAPTNPCNSNYNDDEYWFEYTAVDDGESLQLDVTDITETWAGIFVIDDCPSGSPTCVVDDTNNGSTADLTVTTPPLTSGVSYKIVISNWGTPNNTAFTLNSTVIPPPTCFGASATTSVVEDCGNDQFSIDVDVTDLGDSTTVTVANDGGVASTDVTATGVVTVGPFPIGTPVTISLLHESDASCDVALAPVVDNCPVFTSVDCTGAAVNTTFCYDSNQDILYSFTSSDGSALVVDFIEGYFEDCCDDITIYDGLTTSDPVLFASDTNYNNDATGISATSTGDSVLVRLTSDGSVSCAAGSGSGIPLSFDVFCATCIPPTGSVYVEEDCAVSGGFNVVAELTDLGSSTSFTISDDQGSPSQSATAPGTYTFGPYVNGTLVTLFVDSDQDANCSDTFTDLTQEVCPPDNDDCDEAVPLTVNLDYDNTIVTAGTTVGATASAQDDDVTGTPNTDVWFTFTAVYDEHRIQLLNIVNQGGGTSTSVDMGMGVYDGTAGCNALVFFDDSDPNTLNLTGLTVGTLYYVRVYGWFSTVQYNNFDISVGSDPGLGIDDINNPAAFTYYPNPVKNTLTLNAQNTIENVTMYNMLGQEVLSATPNTVDSELDMSQLQTGTYFIKVTIANTTQTIRVIKQ